MMIIIATSASVCGAFLFCFVRVQSHLLYLLFQSVYVFAFKSFIILFIKNIFIFFKTTSLILKYILILCFVVLLDSSGDYGYSSKSFVFSLRDNEGLAPFKSLVNRPSRAIYRSPYYGPTFGRGDICIANNANSTNLSFTDFEYSYQLPSGVHNKRTILAGTYFFSPDEVEVFYLDPSH